MPKRYPSPAEREQGPEPSSAADSDGRGSETPAPPETASQVATTETPATPQAPAAVLTAQVEPTAAPEPATLPVWEPSPPVPDRAALTNVAPRSLRSPSTGILDVHGQGFRPDLQARFLKGGGPAAGLTVLRQRYVRPTLVQVVVRVDSGVRAGAYGLALADAQGLVTNVLEFRIAP